MLRSERLLNIQGQGGSPLAFIRCVISITALLFGLAAFAPQTYAQSAMLLWTLRYDGPAGGDDFGYGLTVDSSGNVFVTGESSNGANNDWATIKYSSAGVPLWTNRYNGPGNGDDYGFGVAVDNGGNVFVAGASTAINGYSDFATIKYSNGGVPLWTNHYNGPGNREDGGSVVTLDGSGNVIAAGSSSNGTNSDFATIKYSGEGVLLWTNRYDGPGNGADSLAAMGVDGSGNVFVTGISAGSGTGGDYATVAYSDAGVPMWTNRFTAQGISGDFPTALAVDASGDVFVTGYSTAYGSLNYTTIKYSDAGVPLWTNRYDGPTQNEDQARDMALDDSGAVIVAGDSWDGVSWDYVTIKYSGAGVPVWTNRYDGPTNDTDQVEAVAVDSNGIIWVTGYSEGGGSDYDYATVAYSGAGVPLWTNRYDGPGNFFDQPVAMAVDNSGSVFVTGLSWNGANDDYATLKFSSIVPPIILAIEPDGGGGYFLWFSGVPGVAYRLQRATSLDGPWATSAPQTAPDSGLVEFWDLFAPPGQGFYRTFRP